MRFRSWQQASEYPKMLVEDIRRAQHRYDSMTISIIGFQLFRLTRTFEVQLRPTTTVSHDAYNRRRYSHSIIVSITGRSLTHIGRYLVLLPKSRGRHILRHRFRPHRRWYRMAFCSWWHSSVHNHRDDRDWNGGRRFRVSRSCS